MHPKEFKEYWGLTNQELAQLLGISVDGVKHWFRKENPGNPSPSVEVQLDQLHVRFLTWKAEDEHLPLEVREIYLAAITRLRDQK